MSVTETGRQPRVFDRRRKMYFYVDNIVIDHYAEHEDMDSYALAVYMVLARLASRDGASFPYNGYLQKKTGASKRKVRYALRTLEKLGLIEVSPRYREDGSHTANDYVLLEVNPGLIETPAAPHAVPPAQYAGPPESPTARSPRTYAVSGLTPLGEENIDINGEMGVTPNGETVDLGRAPNSEEQGSKYTTLAPAPGEDHADLTGSLASGTTSLGPHGATSHTENRMTWWRLYRERAEEAGVEITDRDPQIIGGNLGKLAKREDVTDADMYQVVANLLSLAASGKHPGSPQQALERVRGDVREQEQERERKLDPYWSYIGWRVGGMIGEEIAAAGRRDENGYVLPRVSDSNNSHRKLETPEEDGYRKVHRPDRDGIKSPEQLEAQRLRKRTEPDDEEGWVTVG